MKGSQRTNISEIIKEEMCMSDQMNFQNNINPTQKYSYVS